jgi:hypothetical protein
MDYYWSGSMCPLRIGYSFWGFLGNGIVDTPDGGRSHRMTLLRGLKARGHSLLFLQIDRDKTEAGDDFSWVGEWQTTGFPEIDLLFLEWRWPIVGRNVGPFSDSADYTPDLARQRELIMHYVVERRSPTILWDKDLRLPGDDRVRAFPWVRVAEAAAFPSEGTFSLRFPVADFQLDAEVVNCARPLRFPLVYVGNQYERDSQFDRYFAEPARRVRHSVFGKWPKRSAWPHVTFRGRVGFDRIAEIYRASAATVLLAPDRYEAVGQVTQRIFESVLNGCFPIAPATIRGVEKLVPEWLIATEPLDVERACRNAMLVRSSDHYLAELDRCRKSLEPFRLSRQIAELVRMCRELSLQL